MNASAVALLGYCAWTLLLLTTLGGLRVGLVVGRGRKPNSFTPQGDDVSAFSQRLCRVHANCYESFPIFGGLLLLALALDLAAITDGLALVALAARVGQSVVHLLSTSVMAVNLRFAFFLLQVGIWLYWVWKLAVVLL